MALKKKAKKVAKKAAPKKVVKAKTKRKPNPAFMKPLQPSEQLSAIVGNKPMPRTKVVKALWEYIKKNKLQDSNDKRTINADDKLQVIFEGKKSVDMFKMATYVNKHLS